jgi:hypothetical protein
VIRMVIGDPLGLTGILGMKRTVRPVFYSSKTHPDCFAVEPDAGIVNFYQEKDTLMAHVDRSEVCATSPLVSIS